ncbi:glutamate-1-semialdehyde 2,1-aminomutase [Cognatishimia sp. WU-CL00825]|uniref:aspartate aminotransferase family protein n=1 Tax=Cognatishimia sp. WU-CL00825 TaxID=3127658 RepID=UPI00310933BE
MGQHSQALSERAEKVLVDGGNSASRGPRVFKPYPPYIERAEGCRLYDVDGESYIDWMNAFGALSTGHAHPAVVEAASRAVATGAHYAAAIPEEIEYAELIVDMVSVAEKVRFANSGTEACMAAIRLARGHTGRKKIVKFEGHYHGWADSLLLTTNPQPVTTLGHENSPVGIVDSSGIPHGAVEDTIVLPWNNIEALERLFKDRGREIACVATEGVMANIGVIRPKDGYLQRMQELCREYDVLFYLDETVTGFRVAPGGCIEMYGLEPDIVTYGKAIGHGFPLAAICASHELMDGLGWGKVMHFGTFNAHRVGVSAGLAGTKALAANRNAGFKHLTEIGQATVEGINEVIAKQNRHQILVQSVGSLFQFYFTDRPELTDFRDYCLHADSAKFARFANHLRGFGVYVSPSNTLHNCSTLGHDHQDVEATVQAFAEALKTFE